MSLRMFDTVFAELGTRPCAREAGTPKPVPNPADCSRRSPVCEATEAAPARTAGHALPMSPGSPTACPETSAGAPSRRPNQRCRTGGFPLRAAGALALCAAGLLWPALALSALGKHAAINPAQATAPLSATDRRLGAEATSPLPGSGPGRTRPIEHIKVGDRVWADNPEAPEAARRAPDPDPATWRHLRLSLVNSDGRLVKAELLRPQAWVQAVGAFAGARIPLHLPEMACAGSAEIVALGPCPEIPPGPGAVVTGTFVLETAPHVLDLFLEGLAAPIGVTRTHLIYSFDRRIFLPAEDLQPGEQVQAALTACARVQEIRPRPGVHTVYNVEVHGEHVYRVSALGVLVHNSGGLAPKGHLPFGDEPLMPKPKPKPPKPPKPPRPRPDKPIFVPAPPEKPMPPVAPKPNPFYPTDG